MKDPVSEPNRATGVLWFITLLAGCAAIYVFRPPDALSALRPAAIAVPLLCMVLYVVIGRFQGASWNTLADPVYFLGFLWTIWVLVEATLLGENPARGGEDIFRVFAFALVTTGVGMALRVLLLHLAPTEDVIDPSTRASLDQLNGAIAGAAASLTMFSKNMRGDLTDVSESLAGSVAAMQKTAVEAHEEIMRLAREELRGAVTHVATELRAIALPFEQVQREADNFNSNAGAALRRLADLLEPMPHRFERGFKDIEQSLKDVVLPADFVKSRFDAVVDVVGREGTALSTELTKLLLVIGERVRAIEGALTTLPGAEDVRKANETLATALAGLSETTRNVAAVLAAQSEPLVAVGAAATAAATGLGTLPPAAEKLRETTKAMVGGLQAEQLDAAERIKRTLVSFEAASVELQSAIRDIVEFLRHRSAR